jgi:hypothetical protein
MSESRTQRGAMRDDPRHLCRARWLGLRTCAAVVVAAHTFGPGTSAGASEIIAQPNSPIGSIHLTSFVPPARLAATIVALQDPPPGTELEYDPGPPPQYYLILRSGRRIPVVSDGNRWVPAPSRSATAADSTVAAYGLGATYGWATAPARIAPAPQAPAKSMPAAVAPARTPTVPSKSMPAAAPSRQAGA